MRRGHALINCSPTCVVMRNPPLTFEVLRPFSPIIRKARSMIRNLGKMLAFSTIYRIECLFAPLPNRLQNGIQLTVTQLGTTDVTSPNRGTIPRQVGNSKTVKSKSTPSGPGTLIEVEAEIPSYVSSPETEKIKSMETIWVNGSGPPRRSGTMPTSRRRVRMARCIVWRLRTNSPHFSPKSRSMTTSAHSHMDPLSVWSRSGRRRTPREGNIAGGIRGSTGKRVAKHTISHTTELRGGGAPRHRRRRRHECGGIRRLTPHVLR